MNARRRAVTGRAFAPAALLLAGAIFLAGCVQDLGEAPSILASFGFETDVTCSPWCTTASPGNVDPYIWRYDTSTSSGGGRSVRSGFISHNQFSCLEYDPSFQTGSVEFMYRIDSEAGFDFLVLYINGIEVAAGSGFVDWSSFAQVAPARGFNSWEWCYEKDGSVSVGADAAWIDDVVAY